MITDLQRKSTVSGGLKRTGKGALIFNADDWGRDKLTTDRTVQCFDAGAMSSVSAMVFMEDSERAAEIAHERSIDAGLHLNLDTPFSAPRCSDRLLEHQSKLAKFLRHPFARPIFHPGLSRSFEYLVSAQIDEYRRLYGTDPRRVDGHHHMHLSANVLLGGLLSGHITVRRHFSYESGEKRLRNGLFRLYSKLLIEQRYATTDFLFSLPPLQPERLSRIFGLAEKFFVEVETHPVNDDELRFLVDRKFEAYGAGQMSRAYVTRQKRVSASDAMSHASESAGSSERRVVILFAEALAAPEVAWSLVDAGFKVVALRRNGKRSALQYSRYVSCREISAPESNLQQALADLRSFLAEDSKSGSTSVLLPLDDTAVWLCNNVQLPENWIVAGPQQSTADIALNKDLQTSLAREAGFNVPHTAVANTSQEVLDFGAKTGFPIILKPVDCVPVRNGRKISCRKWICASATELQRAVDDWRERTPLLLQNFIVGNGEGIFGLAAPEGVRAWSAHSRLRMMNPQGSGSSACVSVEVSSELKSKAEALVSKAGWRGLFMIELLRDDSGKIWFVELNGRPWGSIALARRQGLEYPAWSAELALDETSDAGTHGVNHPGVVCRNVGRELMHLLFVIRGPRSTALTHWPKISKSLVELLRMRSGDCYYNWREDDKKVFFADSYYTLHQNLFKSRD